MEPPPFLPEELQLKILLRLPVKSLLRFRCVSKSWKSIISGSQFIKLHLHRSSSTSIRRNADFDHLCLLVNSPPATRSATTVANPYYTFIGSCNGLICFGRSSLGYDGQNHIYFYLFYFWNPATMSVSQHSLPLCISTSTKNEWSFGFGYDSSTETYKVVAFTFRYSSFSFETMVNVYNMGDACWRTIQVSHLPRMGHKSHPVYLNNNTLNWIAFLPDVIINENDASDPFRIFSFDLRKENCAQLSLPCCPRVDSLRPILGVLRGSLCICQTYKMTPHFEIWQMKEFGVHQSWTLLFNIVDQAYIITRNICRWPSFTMYMSENGDVMLLSTKSGVSLPQAVLYTEKGKKLEVTNIDNYIVHYYVNNYIESLVAPS